MCDFRFDTLFIPFTFQAPMGRARLVVKVAELLSGTILCGTNCTEERKMTMWVTWASSRPWSAIFCHRCVLCRLMTENVWQKTEKSRHSYVSNWAPQICFRFDAQLRIGMDLTKITLPTYILERRSLLEMYADFFAHTDLFVKIATCETPQERMVQCMRWYLSAFHAGKC